jgi:hypothetical protein
VLVEARDTLGIDERQAPARTRSALCRTRNRRGAALLRRLAQPVRVERPVRLYGGSDRARSAQPAFRGLAANHPRRLGGRTARCPAESARRALLMVDRPRQLGHRLARRGAPPSHPSCASSRRRSSAEGERQRASPVTCQAIPECAKVASSPRSSRTASIADGGWANVRNCRRRIRKPTFRAAMTNRETALRRG